MKLGDRINVTAICVFADEDKYLFTVEDNPLDVPLIVNRDPTDKAHNQRIDDALDELIID